jgi:hypothetical protein
MKTIERIKEDKKRSSYYHLVYYSSKKIERELKALLIIKLVKAFMKSIKRTTFRKWANIQKLSSSIKKISNCEIDVDCNDLLKQLEEEAAHPNAIVNESSPEPMPRNHKNKYCSSSSDRLETIHEISENQEAHS